MTRTTTTLTAAPTTDPTAAAIAIAAACRGPAPRRGAVFNRPHGADEP